jgi:hypothetical protein
MKPASNELKENAISQNFELRTFSSNPDANGETDFKGGTSTLTTEERIEFLSEYFRQAQRYHPDLDLNHSAVSLDESRRVLQTLKPRPLPTVRRRFALDDWSWTSAPACEEKRHRCQVRGLNGTPGIAVNNTGIVFESNTELALEIPEQTWRFFMEWMIPANSPRTNMDFRLDEAVIFGFEAGDALYWVTDGCRHRQKIDSAERVLRVEVDLESGRYNLECNGQRVADFVPLAGAVAGPVSCWRLKADAGARIGRLWGVGYRPHKAGDREPYSIETFVDEDFAPDVDLSGWNDPEYDDTGWQSGTLPVCHGGERNAGEDLLFRRHVRIEELPDYAELDVESITPGGELYVNGRLAELFKDAYPRKVDITPYLKPGPNLLAVRVYAYAFEEADKMPHTHTDRHTGWFLGRMHLDLLPAVYLEDLYSWTESIAGDSARQGVRVTIRKRRGSSSTSDTEATVRVKLHPWFPVEEAVCATAEWKTDIHPNLSETTEGVLDIAEPKIWTYRNPQLYKLTVELYDDDGVLCDDLVRTIGIRTVSQRDGIFRINDQPELLRAPLLFGARPPLDQIAAWEKCPPPEYLVQEMLMIRGMNGNGIRMSVHDGRMGGINDPRICEYADQLGLMLVWQTSAWLRETSVTNLDLEGLAACVKQVRNHCSIVIWQPTNHPSWRNWTIAMRMYRRIYETIAPLDSSRLISPSADSRRLRPHDDSGGMDYNGNPDPGCDSIWTAPLICRGNMDYPLGYGNEWPALRQWPQVDERHLPAYMETTAYIPSFIDSPDRAYFNFEHDEVAGQPNWELHKGKPTYQTHSYEISDNGGSLGRDLSFDEWGISQAWQAFAAYESIKKYRWLDYDGLCWCCLRGGANTATYQKPVIDYYGAPKLAYYIHRMAFQDVLAASGNVDTVYGPGDDIPVVVLNLGDAKRVRVTVAVKHPDGRILEEKSYENVHLPSGRSVTRLTPFSPAPQEGLLCIEYRVETNN